MVVCQADRDVPASFTTKGGRTILIISHQERIIRLADEIVLIANGEIAGRGTADELYPKLLSQTVAGCNLLEVNGTC